MNRIFNYILIIACLFIYGQNIYAQTLNADTLVKYHIIKIITYELDSTGQKVLKQTRHFNNKGLPVESCTYNKNYIESKLHSISIDSVKCDYNKNGKIASHINNRTVISYYEGTEKTSHYSFMSTYHYNRPFIVSIFQKETQFYIYKRKEEKIIKRYLNGRHDGYFNYSDSNGYKYSVEKYYKVHHKRKVKDVIFFHRRFKSNLNQKHILKIKSTFNSNGDVIQENILTIFYFTKPLEYSYIKTYKYDYKDSLIVTRTASQPYYIYTSKPKKETAANEYKRSKKIIFFIEERGILEETEIYEYITNPE